MSYEKHLDFKQEEVYNNIKRISGIDNFEIVSILGSEEQYLIEIK